MRTFEQLEALWAGEGPSPRDRGTVELIVCRLGDGAHEVVERGRLDPELGLDGDRWSKGETPELHSQITFMNARVARALAGDDIPLHQSGDNFLVDLDLSEASLPPGSRVRLGGALLEVTEEPHLGCHKFRARFGADALRWVNLKPNRPQRLRGLHCRVVEAGEVARGDAIEVVSRPKAPA